MANVRISPPIIVDELTIREYRMDDVEALDAAIVRNREHLLPWVGDWIKREPIGLDARRALMHTWVETYPTGGDNAVGIFIGNELVGGTGLHDRNAPGDVEIGYWVDTRYEGRGIATRVAAALTDHAFHHPSVERVLIIHAAGNTKSRRIPEKIGFREVPGEHVCGDAPGVRWECTRQEWDARQGPVPSPTTLHAPPTSFASVTNVEGAPVTG